MANKPGKDNLEDILCALRHEQATIREQAIQRLNTYANSAGGNTNDNTLTGAEAWEAGRRAIRQTLQQSLIVEALLIAIDELSVQVRAYAASMLGHLTVLEAQEALLWHLRNDPSDKVRIVCAWALPSIPDSPRVVEAFIAALQDSSDAVVSFACITLGEKGGRQAIEPLRRMLVHPSWNVRFHSCKALVTLEAVDHQVVDVLGVLNQQPEAEEYNDFKVNQKENPDLYDPWGLHKDKQAQTTQVVLDQARRALP